MKNEYEQLVNNLLLSIKMNIDHWYYSFGKDPDLLLLNPIAYYFISRTNDIDSINGTLFGVKIHTITSQQKEDFPRFWFAEEQKVMVFPDNE